MNIDNLFKGLLHNRYVRTKIFKHVEIIHQQIIDSDSRNRYVLVLKSHQIVTLCQCIILNRTDLFIKHFDSVYQSSLLSSSSSLNEKEESIYKSETFKQILNTIFEYDGYVALEYLFKRFGGIEKSTLRSIVFGNVFAHPVPIGLCRLLIRYNYHLPDSRDNETDHFIFIGQLTRHVVMNGDVEMFDRICRDYLDDISNIGFYGQWGSFADLINKLNNQQKQQHHTTITNNQSKYDIIFDMVSELLLFGQDLRLVLFLDALECLNNQEIIRWIIDSYDVGREGFIKMFQQSRVVGYIERYANKSTLELIEFKLSSPLVSTEATRYGNLDFLSYMYDAEEFNYLFNNTHLQTSLFRGQLECTNYLMTIAAKQGVTSLLKYGKINPSIVSLDLVKRLVECQCQMADLNQLVESIILSNQPETLRFILNLQQHHGEIDMNLVSLSLRVDNTVITEMLLDLFSGDQSQTFTLSQDNNLFYGPLLSLFNRGHTVQFELNEEVHDTTRNQTPISPETVQLLIDRLSIGRIPPRVLLSSLKHPHFKHIKELGETLSRFNMLYQDGIRSLRLLQIIQVFLTELCKKTLDNSIELLKDWVQEFGDLIFQTSIQHHQIQLATDIGQLFSTSHNEEEMSEKKVFLILDTFFEIENDQDFEMIWQSFLPVTTSSFYVSKMISQSTNFLFSQRHRVTDTLDRIIKQYTRHYNGPERDQFNMTPIKINNELTMDPLNIHHLFTNYRDCPIIDFTDFNLEGEEEDRSIMVVLEPIHFYSSESYFKGIYLTFAVGRIILVRDWVFLDPYLLPLLWYCEWRPLFDQSPCKDHRQSMSQNRSVATNRRDGVHLHCARRRLGTPGNHRLCLLCGADGFCLFCRWIVFLPRLPSD
ncbi:hypothetical protein DFA_11012 [Cavenderia fasciculata]|uniref:Uncharacterized protein n=1 Tax=Cavenderia fasciculata TaxID=261658 RepID=F4QC14_CACFS|nr:uncharacterized protein DFA_11012 [Cavenderia fasciculata]EGG14752.1 hypothetical protein DFA_11012 [Cavenderia fasciculata]|eukprot:XP_004351260.1 hypothetical protein DFA_11012 [Cavenderia fasciculata]